MNPPTKSRFGDTVTTERLLLRPLAPTDMDDVFAIRSDPKVLYWTDPDTREKSKEWLNARLESPKSMVYTVFLLPPKEDSPKGLPASTEHPSEKPRLQCVGLTGAARLPEIGHTFLPSTWGKGYATEALKAWIAMYWERFPEGHPMLSDEERNYLKAVTGPGGEGSRAVLRKCGFEWWAEEEVEDERKGAKEKDTRVVLVESRLQRPKAHC